MTARRSLVTGGAGFIGSHLVDRLVAEGDDVTVLDDFSRGSRHNLERSWDDVRIVEADAADVDAVTAAAEGVDAIFHLAARPSVVESVADPFGSMRANLVATVAALEAARRAEVPRLVFASSCAVYGDEAPVPVSEDATPRPLSPYSLQKLAGEQHCRLFWELYGVESVALRFFNVYGPRQDPEVEYAAVVPRFVRAALRGEEARVYGDGEQTRDFVFVEDVADVMWTAALAPGERVAGSVLNVAGGQPVSVNRLVEAVGQAAGRPLRVRREPARTGEIRHSGADTARASQLLGWKASFPLQQGLAKTVESAARTTREKSEV